MKKYLLLGGMALCVSAFAFSMERSLPTVEGGEAGLEPAKQPEKAPERAPIIRPGGGEPTLPPVEKPGERSGSEAAPASLHRGGTTVPDLGSQEVAVSAPEKGNLAVNARLAQIEHDYSRNTMDADQVVASIEEMLENYTMNSQEAVSVIEKALQMVTMTAEQTAAIFEKELAKGTMTLQAVQEVLGNVMQADRMNWGAADSVLERLYTKGILTREEFVKASTGLFYVSHLMGAADFQKVTTQISTLAANSPAAAGETLINVAEKSVTALSTAPTEQRSVIGQFLIDLLGLFKPAVISSITDDERVQARSVMRQIFEGLANMGSAIVAALRNAVRVITGPTLEEAYQVLGFSPEASSSDITTAYNSSSHFWQLDLQEAIEENNSFAQDAARSRLSNLRASYNVIAQSRGMPRV